MRPPLAVQAQHPPLTGLPRLAGTLALSAATFMSVLDTSIANVSLSAMAGELGVSPMQGTWVITSFAVASAISVPLTGWLTQRVGQVRLFMLSVLLFVLSSWLCGLANSMTTLVLFRVLQGFFAGPLIPLSQTLLLSSYPPAMAATAMAVWSVTTLVAPIMGPLLGGWITENMSWPWIFYINVPVGLLTAAATWVIYRERETATSQSPIDTVGLVLLVIWVSALQLMLDKGKELDWFHSNQIIAFAVVALVGLALFLAWELTEEHPVVDLSLFRHRNFWSGTLAVALGYAVFFGNVVILPLWLQQFMGYTPIQAGMILAPAGVFAIVFSPLVGATLNRVDPRKYASFSFLVFALALWMRSRLTTQADFGAILLPTLVQGVAMAFIFVPLITITLSGLEPSRIAAASGLSNFIRIMAGAVGTSVSTTMWENRATLHHSHLVENIHQGNQTAMNAITAMQAHGMSHEQALGHIHALAIRQAYMLSSQDVFYGSAVLLLLLIPLLWLSRRP